jgi:hypothetical protein
MDADAVVRRRWPKTDPSHVLCSAQPQDKAVSCFESLPPHAHSGRAPISLRNRVAISMPSGERGLLPARRKKQHLFGQGEVYLRALDLDQETWRSLLPKVDVRQYVAAVGGLLGLPPVFIDSGYPLSPNRQAAYILRLGDMQT